MNILSLANRTHLAATLFMFTTVLLPLQSMAADAEHGEKLYKERCHGCHDTRVHTRPNRIIHTYEDLVNRVRFCDTQAKAGFSDSDINDVSEYLNKEFYHFLKVKDNE
ncbi:MAG: hypothetical protein PVJ39_17080 [Gammaproteobacteria bacterium]|jgi:cytochrome c2